IRVPARAEHSRPQVVQRSRAMCWCVPVHDRGAMFPSPGRLHRAQGGFGHENRVYLSGTGVVSIIAVLLWQGMDQKIQSRRQLCHVTVLQDYPASNDRDWQPEVSVTPHATVPGVWEK